MVDAKPPEVILFTRQGCHLCDEARDLLRRYGIAPRLIDIDGDEQLRQRYTECVPVVVIGGKERFRGRINEVLLRRLLTAGKLPNASEQRTGIRRQAPVDSQQKPQQTDDGPSARGSWPRAAGWLTRWLFPASDATREVVEQGEFQRGVRSLGIMAKYWESGSSKTRLGATIGHVEAAQLSRQFLVHLLRHLRTTADVRTLVFSPDERRAAFESLCEDPSIGGGAWQCEPQGSGDLGERMERYVRQARKRGADKIILIGSDMPTIPQQSIDEAWEALDSYPVVLGPAEDGGYYLIGIVGDPPPIFAGVPWGTSQVLAWTRHLLEQQGLPYHQLALGYDVDRREDLVRLGQELACRDARSFPADTELLASIRAVLDSQ